MPPQPIAVRFRKASRSTAGSWFKFSIVIAAFILVIARGTQQLGYDWDWDRVPEYLVTATAEGYGAGPLLEGLLVTFKITILSLLLSFVLGLGAALLRLSESYVGRLVARTYVELIRNTPLLIQIFFVYFVAAPVFDLGRFTSAVLALSLFEGAYGSEIIRSGIASIHKGQWEACYSLGLSKRHTYRTVILPQAFRRVLPPLTSQAISLIKDSALVSTIAIYDLTMRGQEIVARTFLTFEIWFTVAALYLAVTVSLSAVVGFMEKRMKVES